LGRREPVDRSSSALNLGDEIVRPPRRERPAAMKRFVQRHAEAELIAAVVNATAPQCLDAVPGVPQRGRRRG